MKCCRLTTSMIMIYMMYVIKFNFFFNTREAIHFKKKNQINFFVLHSTGLVLGTIATLPLKLSIRPVTIPRLLRPKSFTSDLQF